MPACCGRCNTAFGNSFVGVIFRKTCENCDYIDEQILSCALCLLTSSSSRDHCLTIYKETFYFREICNVKYFEKLQQ